MKALWLVTFVTHNARVSDRMIKVGVQRGHPIILTPAQIRLVAETLIEAWTRHSIPVCACNVLPDHVHIIIAADSENALHELVRKLKGFTSYKFNRANPSMSGPLWQQKFNRKVIPNDEALRNALEYVWNNHRKHLPHEEETRESEAMGFSPLKRGAEKVSNDLRQTTPHSEATDFSPLKSKKDKGLKPPCLTYSSKTPKVYTVDKHEAVVDILRNACMTVEEIFNS